MLPLFILVKPVAWLTFSFGSFKENLAALFFENSERAFFSASLEPKSSST